MLYRACNYLSRLILKLIYVSNRGLSCRTILSYIVGETDGTFLLFSIYIDYERCYVSSDLGGLLLKDTDIR